LHQEISEALIVKPLLESLDDLCNNHKPTKKSKRSILLFEKFKQNCGYDLVLLF
jgi:hypothetical protein